MKVLFAPFLCFLFLLFSCTNNNAGTDNKLTSEHPGSQIGSNYMPTGFYFVADDGEGVKMRLEHSNQVIPV